MEQAEATMEHEYMIHIAGPYNLAGPYTEIEALRKANVINMFWVEDCGKKGIETTPMCVATVKFMEDK